MALAWISTMIQSHDTLLQRLCGRCRRHLSASCVGIGREATCRLALLRRQAFLPHILGLYSNPRHGRFRFDSLQQLWSPLGWFPRQARVSTQPLSCGSPSANAREQIRQDHIRICKTGRKLLSNSDHGIYYYRIGRTPILLRPLELERHTRQDRIISLPTKWTQGQFW